MGAIDRLAVLADEGHGIIGGFRLRRFLLLIDIQRFGTEAQAHSRQQHDKPGLPAASTLLRIEVDAGEKARQTVEKEVNPPLDIDEHRPEIAVQVAGHIKRLGIEQNMVVTHVDEVRDEPCIDDEREGDEPALVAQQECKRSKAHRRRQLAKQHRDAVLDGRLQGQFAEGEMVEEQGLTENKQREQTEDQPVLLCVFHTLAIK